MQLIKKIIIGLIILVIVAAVVSLFFLNEAQRMIVGMAAGLGVINLLGRPLLRAEECRWAEREAQALRDSPD